MALLNFTYDARRKAQEAEEQRRRQLAREQLYTLAELDQLQNRAARTAPSIDPATGAPPPQPLADPATGFIPDFGNPQPAAARAAEDVVSRLLAQQELGINPAQAADADFTRARLRTFDQVAQAIQDPAQLANVANKLDASPIRAAGGITYSRFGDGQVLDESSAVEALAGQRRAAERDADLRYGALAEVLQDPATDPLIAADVANQRKSFTGERIKVQRPDGTAVYGDRILNPDGTYGYSEARDAAGGPVLIPAGADRENLTSEERNIMNRMRILGVSEQAALRSLMSTRDVSPAKAWAEAGKHMLTIERGRYARKNATPEEQREKQEQIYRALFPDYPLPEEGGFGGTVFPAEPPASDLAPPPPTPAGVAPTPPAAPAESEATYQEARAAIAAGAPPEAVRARLRSMGLDPNRL